MLFADEIENLTGTFETCVHQQKMPHNTLSVSLGAIFVIRCHDGLSLSPTGLRKLQAIKRLRHFAHSLLDGRLGLCVEQRLTKPHAAICFVSVSTLCVVLSASMAANKMSSI